MRTPSVALLATLLAAACTDARKDEPTPTCRRLAPSADGPGDVEELFPLVEGDVWFHHLDANGVAFTVRTEMGPPTVLDGLTAHARTMLGVDEATFPSIRYFSNGPSGVVAHLPRAAPPVSDAFPHVAIRWPVVEGDVYETFACTDMPARADLDGDGMADLYDVRQEVRVGGVETIDVFFGSFEARKVTTVTSYTYRQSGGDVVPLEEREATWYAPGIGRIGSLGQRTGQGVTVVIADLLSGYRRGAEEEGLQGLETLDPPALGVPSIAVGPGGGLVAAAMTGDGGAYLGGFALGVDGLVGASLPLMTMGGDTLQRPAVAASDGAFLVALAYPTGLRVARISPAGERLDALDGIAVADGPVRATALASDGQGWGLLWAGDDVRFARIAADGSVLGDQVLAATRAEAPALVWVGGHYLALWISGDGLHVLPVDALGAAGAETVVDLGDVRGFSAEGDGDDVHAVWLDGSRTVRTSRLSADGVPLDAVPATLFAGRDIDVAYDLRLAFDGTNHVATFMVFSLDGQYTGAHAALVTPDGTAVAIRGGTSSKLAPYGEFAAVLPALGGETRFLWKRGERFQVGSFAF